MRRGWMTSLQEIRRWWWWWEWLLWGWKRVSRRWQSIHRRGRIGRSRRNCSLRRGLTLMTVLSDKLIHSGGSG